MWDSSKGPQRVSSCIEERKAKEPVMVDKHTMHAHAHENNYISDTEAHNYELRVRGYMTTVCEYQRVCVCVCVCV